MTDNRYGHAQYGAFGYGIRAARILTRTATATADAAVETTRTGIDKTRTTSLSLTTTQETVVSNFTDVLNDGLLDRNVTFDTERGCFITDWQHEENWLDNETFAVRVVSDVETQPIDVAVERDDTGDGDPDTMSDWRTVTATETPVTFPEITAGETNYRVLLRYIRPSDHVHGIDTGFVN